ncbi:oxidoreductase [Dehalobacter sp. DCM]|uniref:4Fe-4S dicluster domain-containing protein n=1 Tax=Dehalobacter sp. DCM TaxID=2907827 RepID=UPI003081FBE1|nr:oxidoreductase [Dehalobacter sp. DCM]
MANNKYGILIDYEYCTGCHSCEVACKKEHDLAEGQYGIQLTEIGPWKINDDKWEYTFMPVITKLCDLCAERTAMGKVPTCVHHCQAWCMYYGTVDELTEKMTGKTRAVLITPEQ